MGWAGAAGRGVAGLRAPNAFRPFCPQPPALLAYLLGVGVCLRRLLAGGAGFWDGVPVWAVGFASGGSSPEGLVSGMASALGTGLGWVVLAAIPSTPLRAMTPGQGGRLLVVLPGFGGSLSTGLGLAVGPAWWGGIRLGQVVGMAARTTRGLWAHAQRLSARLSGGGRTH